MSNFVVKEHRVTSQHIREYARATAHSQEEVLEVAVKEYIPRDNQSPKEGDVTILGAHANGFPKELYEPLWDELYLVSKKQGFRIRSIIIADAAHQGHSGQLNRSKLGNDPSWLDYTRDILQVINTLRPPVPIIGVGHSFGAAALVNLALFHPRLLASLVLLDPVISPFSSTYGPMSQSPAAQSLKRREVWPSRADAAAGFLRSPFYKAWDPRVLDKWVEHGLRDVTPEDRFDGERGVEGQVTLATTKHQEVFTFLRPSWRAYDDEGKVLVHRDEAPDMDNTNASIPTYPFYRPEPVQTLARVANIRPSVFYLIGGKSNVSHPIILEERLPMTGIGPGGNGGVKTGGTRQVIFPEGGHLIPMEVPREVAELTGAWVGEKLAQWRAGEKKAFDAWKVGMDEQKRTLGDDWWRYLEVKKKVGKPKAKI